MSELIYIADFSYYQGKRKYYCELEFKAENIEGAQQKIAEYVKTQNRGEPPSDRIKFTGKITRKL